MSADWLALREPADAAARAAELVEQLPAPERWVIHDLGCGTGAMGRWLAPRLPGPQHWVLHDTDADLLEVAAADPPAAGATVEARLSDVTRVDLSGATLVTASALLDLLTEDELDRLVRNCVRAGCPALLMLSVVGHVELTPADPLDGWVADAFNAHQRCRALGPDAPARARERFAALGAEVIERPSPWRLGPARSELVSEWFEGWLRAACEQDPALAAEAGSYRRRRPVEGLTVTVDHVDLLCHAPSNRGESA